MKSFWGEFSQKKNKKKTRNVRCDNTVYRLRTIVLRYHTAAIYENSNNFQNNPIKISKLCDKNIPFLMLI